MLVDELIDEYVEEKIEKLKRCEVPYDRLTITTNATEMNRESIEFLFD